MGLLSKAMFRTVPGKNGGLLKKMMLVSRPVKRNPSPAVTPRPREGGGGGGFLKKTLLFVGHEEEEKAGDRPPVSVDYLMIGAGLRKEIARLPKNFSYFPALFSILIRELKAARGALFLYNFWHHEFVPWLHRGLAPHFASALSFTEKRWREVIKKPFSQPFTLENERAFFPSLPRGLPKPLLMLPFTNQGRLAGSFLLSGLALSSAGRRSLFTLFEELSATIGENIAAITREMEEITPPEDVFASPQAALPVLLEPKTGLTRPLRVMVVPLNPLWRALRGKSAFFDTGPLRDTLLFLANSWLASLGSVTPHGAADILLITRVADLYSPKLLTASLSNRIRDLFPGLGDDLPTLLPGPQFDYPACGKKPSEIIAALQT